MLSSMLCPLYPEHRILLGALILLFSVLSLASMGGGAGIGLLLGVLGGAFTIGYTPEFGASTASGIPTTVGAATLRSYSPSLSLPTATAPTGTVGGAFADRPTRRACTNCGQINPLEESSCVACGQPLPPVPLGARPARRQS